MKKRRKKSDDVQLYTLIDKLRAYISDSDELGLFVSYSLLDSLRNFETDAGSDQERAIQEIKQAHQGLEKAVEACRESQIYEKLCEMRIGVDPLLENVLQKNTPYTGQSTLMRKIIDASRNHPRNYPDLLRRKGKIICQEVNTQGTITGRRNIQNNDYNILTYAFG